MGASAESTNSGSPGSNPRARIERVPRVPVLPKQPPVLRAAGLRQEGADQVLVQHGSELVARLGRLGIERDGLVQGEALCKERAGRCRDAGCAQRRPEWYTIEGGRSTKYLRRLRSWR